jgi:RimJ/RimL family protein N-acetyltransferase
MRWTTKAFLFCCCIVLFPAAPLHAPTTPSHRPFPLVRADLRLRPYERFLSSEFTWARPFFPQDYKPLYAFYGSREAMLYIGKRMRKRALRDYISLVAHAQVMLPHPFGHWSLITRYGIGGILVLLPPLLQSDSENRGAEVGYGVIPALSGKGIATQAMHMLLAEYRESSKASIHSLNGPAIHVARKNGFRFHSRFLKNDRPFSLWIRPATLSP